MKSQTATGCGSVSCLCAGETPQPARITVNGLPLNLTGPRLDRVALLARVQAELLRQQAVQCGLLPPHAGPAAPEPGALDRQVIQSMLEQAVVTPTPDEADCRRHFDANRDVYVQGQALHVRHILFAVTLEVNVHAVLVRAEQALLELSRPGVPPGRFAQLAAELSNCATGPAGGDLGWIGPDNCDPDLASELFHHKHSRWGMGVHPRLIHTRQGFHILEVLGRRKGKPVPYEMVRERIAVELALRMRADALKQYLARLIHEATIEGLDLDDRALQGAALPDFE